MSEAYCRIIDLIGGNQPIDWRAIGMTLAKANPEAFLMLHDSVSGTAAPGARDQALDRELVWLCAQGRKVDAIKSKRTESGMSLKEAKDYVDALYDAHLKGISKPTTMTINADAGHSVNAFSQALAKLIPVGGFVRGPSDKYQDGGTY